MKIKIMYPNKMGTETTLEIETEEAFISWKNQDYEKQLKEYEYEEGKEAEEPFKYYIEKIEKV